MDHDHTLYSAMKNAASMGPVTELREPTKLDSLLRAMRGRHSSNPIDKVCAIAFPFQKRESRNFHKVTFPIYGPTRRFQ